MSSSLARDGLSMGLELHGALIVAKYNVFRHFVALSFLFGNSWFVFFRLQGLCTIPSHPSKGLHQVGDRGFGFNIGLVHIVFDKISSNDTNSASAELRVLIFCFQKTDCIVCSVAKSHNCFIITFHVIAHGKRSICQGPLDHCGIIHINVQSCRRCMCEPPNCLRMQTGGNGFVCLQ